LSSICNLSSVKIEMREEQRILNEINLSTLENLFSDILFDKNIQHDTDKSNFEISKEYLKKHKLEEKEEKENFVFLGTKGFNYKHDNSTTQYSEVFGRYRSHYKDDNFEFIFNDVSKTKESEEINAEIKYKTIFLSKVAHEFKNPLICVSELVEEVREDLHVFEGLNQLTVVNKNTNNINQTLSQIKSMCEFLLILVKDLDFFSLNYSESTNKIKIEKENVKVETVVNYCKNITNVLLRKYQKEDNIKFYVECEREILNDEIFTDELRLKQLLINLLSNSVKYT